MIAVADTLRGRSFTRVSDWSADEWLTALDLADELKAARAAGEETPLLPGRTLGMIFQKPSTRTRVSFEVGITQLGGTGSTSPPPTSSWAGARRFATRPSCSRATSTRS